VQKRFVTVFRGCTTDRPLLFDVAGTSLLPFRSMVSVRVALPVPALLVALSVTVESLPAVGVPEIKPAVVLTDKPAGSPVAP
jgi:hypothetical protein